MTPINTDLQSLDGIPSHFLLDILSNCSAKHLTVLEAASPDAKIVTEPLWRSLIVKDFSGSDLVENAQDCRQIYQELLEKEQTKQNRLKARLSIINEEESQKKTRGVKLLVRKPRIATLSSSRIVKKSKWQQLLKPTPLNGTRPAYK